MAIYDISVPLHKKMPVWPGEPRVIIKQTSAIAEGDEANVSHLSLGAHTGTHVDAPLHFIADGVSLDKIPLDHFIGDAVVVEILNVDLITEKDIKKATDLNFNSRVIFKTRNSQIWVQGENNFQEDFVALSPDAAEYLVNMESKLVGIDYLSIAPYSDSNPTHEVLLRAGIPILEGLDLSNISPGTYSLFCLPLNIIGVEGAPARAILVN